MKPSQSSTSKHSQNDSYINDSYINDSSMFFEQESIIGASKLDMFSMHGVQLHNPSQKYSKPLQTQTSSSKPTTMTTAHHTKNTQSLFNIPISQKTPNNTSPEFKSNLTQQKPQLIGNSGTGNWDLFGDSFDALDNFADRSMLSNGSKCRTQSISISPQSGEATSIKIEDNNNKSENFSFAGNLDSPEEETKDNKPENQEELRAERGFHRRNENVITTTRGDQPNSVRFSIPNLAIERISQNTNSTDPQIKLLTFANSPEGKLTAKRIHIIDYMVETIKIYLETSTTQEKIDEDIRTSLKVLTNSFIKRTHEIICEINSPSETKDSILKNVRVIERIYSITAKFIQYLLRARNLKNLTNIISKTSFKYKLPGVYINAKDELKVKDLQSLAKNLNNNLHEKQQLCLNEYLKSLANKKNEAITLANVFSDLQEIQTFQKSIDEMVTIIYEIVTSQPHESETVIKELLASNLTNPRNNLLNDAKRFKRDFVFYRVKEEIKHDPDFIIEIEKYSVEERKNVLNAALKDFHNVLNDLIKAVQFKVKKEDILFEQETPQQMQKIEEDTHVKILKERIINSFSFVRIEGKFSFPETEKKEEFTRQLGEFIKLIIKLSSNKKYGEKNNNKQIDELLEEKPVPSIASGRVIKPESMQAFSKISKTSYITSLNTTKLLEDAQNINHVGIGGNFGDSKVHVNISAIDEHEISAIEKKDSISPRSKSPNNNILGELSNPVSQRNNVSDNESNDREFLTPRGKEPTNQEEISTSDNQQVAN